MSFSISHLPLKAVGLVDLEKAVSSVGIEKARVSLVIENGRVSSLERECYRELLSVSNK